ncbi:Multidrug resistance-associated protein 1, partial [Coemansia sp. RSA 455]
HSIAQYPALHAFRRSFVYVGIVASKLLSVAGDNDRDSSISCLAAALSPDNGAGPIKFNRNKRAYVFRGVLAKHWMEFLFTAVGGILLGCSNVWRAMLISRMFSLAGQHIAHHDLVILILATVLKLVVLRALGLQYQLIKTGLRGKVEGALYLSLCRTFVLTPGSSHTSSSLADAKNNLVSPYVTSLFEVIAAVASLASILGSFALLSANIGWRALGVVASMLFFSALSEWASRRHKMRLASQQRPRTLHSRIRDILPSLGAFKMLALEELLFTVRDGDNFDDHASTVLVTAATSLSKMGKSVGVSLAVWVSTDSRLGSIDIISSLQLTASSCADLISRVGVFAGLYQLEAILQSKLVLQPPSAPVLADRPFISIHNAQFRRTGQIDVALRVGSLSATPRQIIGVSGPVGSGKSTLLLAIARELKLVSGTMHSSDSMAYVGQSPWLMNGTIRDNILFGQPYHEGFYTKTLYSCCLDDDIAQMALGDQTLVGDHGAALSGGQRTRVALSRAIYSQADIYLLDNVLSTLDQTVRRLVWDRVLSSKGILADKIRLATLDSTGYLGRCDAWIVVDEGCVTISESLEILPDAPQPSTATEATRSTVAANVRTENVISRTQVAATRSPPANTDPVSTQMEALRQFVRVCGLWTLVMAGVMGIVLFAVPTILYQRQVSSLFRTPGNGSLQRTQGPSRGLLTWVVLEVISDWMSYAIKEFVYVDLARSRIQPAVLMSLARAQMSEIWRSSDFYLVSVVRYTERAASLGVHVFLADSIVMVANLGFVAYSTLRLSYSALAVLILAGAGVVYQRAAKGGGALLAIQRYRRRIIDDMDKTAHDLFSGSRVVRIHGVYGVFGDKLRKLDGWQQAVGALANAVLYTKYLWQYIVDTSLSLGLVGAMLLTDVNIWQLTPASVQLYYETASKSLMLLSQLANLQANATNHALVLQELCDVGNMTPEAPWHIDSKRASVARFSQGRITFSGCNLRYKLGDGLALKGVTFNIRPGEHVGIVGRTGSGKSSLLQALLRVVELESGTISIDGVDVGKIGLHDLRQSISVVPQIAALFEGTVRSNIDPFGEYTDAKVDVAIRSCQLSELGADKWIEGGGRNLSGGQQQLVSICRAVLRRKKILVLDEATANVDEQTEQIISAVVKREFKHSTVLIIAHRLQATAGCSRILVMDEGRLVEQGPPSLLATRDGHYARLLRAAEAGRGGGAASPET